MKRFIVAVLVLLAVVVFESGPAAPQALQKPWEVNPAIRKDFEIRAKLSRLGYDPGSIFDSSMSTRSSIFGGSQQVPTYSLKLEQAINEFESDRGLRIFWGSLLLSTSIEFEMSLFPEKTDKLIAALDAALAESRPSGAQHFRSSEYISSGTGFMVSHAGHMLTNHHVVKDCEKSLIVPRENALQTVQIIRTDPEHDLALLQLPSSATEIAVFRRDGRTIAVGEIVVAVGFPLPSLLAPQQVTTGTVSALAGLYDTPHLIQISTPIQMGNSGGPVLNDAGHVIGVVVSGLDAIKIAKQTGAIPQNVNFAIRGAVARDFLRESGVAFETASSTEKRDTIAIAQSALKFTFVVRCPR